jgi:hypothetical protein
MVVYVRECTVYPTRSSNISKAGAHFTSSASQLQNGKLADRSFLMRNCGNAALPRRAFAPTPTPFPRSHQAGQP